LKGASHVAYMENGKWKSSCKRKILYAMGMGCHFGHFRVEKSEISVSECVWVWV